MSRVSVEQLPGGVWLRDAGAAETVGEHRRRLAAVLPGLPQVSVVVLGCPGTTPLPLGEIAVYWRDLDRDGRKRTRFVPYGPVEGGDFGQALADLLAAPIVCFNGMPTGRPERPQVRTVHPGGDLGWRVFARELGYLPRPAPARPADPPSILSYRVPREVGEAQTPLVHRYAHDAVVEVVPSGLWLRGLATPGHADRVRGRAADPARNLILMDDADPARVARLRGLAGELVDRLDHATRDRSVICLASEAGAGALRLGPTGTPRRRLRFQATPDAEARGLPTAYGLAEERAWLRRAFPREFGPAADLVRHLPGLESTPDELTDAVAVRLYLSSPGAGLDAALRAGGVGRHVPFARCVASGLERLPALRGTAATVAALTADDVREIRERRILTDWGFTHTVTELPANLSGTTDVLIWSATARRTRSLEPDDRNRARDRAVFLPGTRFAVLEAIEPGPATRGRLMLRELAPGEPEHGDATLDGPALSGLHQTLARWAETSVCTRVGADSIARFTLVPGLA